MLVFALDVAVSVTVPELAGAVSVTLEMDSALSVPPPVTAQETPEAVESPVTVALKTWLVPASIDAADGETVTVTDENERPRLVEPPDEPQPWIAARTRRERTHNNKFFMETPCR